MPPRIPSTMHAWTHTSKGAPSQVLHLVSNTPVRHPKKPNELLIKISHSALNPGAAIMMHFVPFFLRHSPAIPEMDFSGTVVEIGPPASSSGPGETDALLGSNAGGAEQEFQIGDEVFGSILVPEHVGGGHGTLAEYVVARAEHCVKKPANAKLEEVAGLGIAGSTALVLIETADLKPGDRVLINAASGGIGSLVVQMAKEKVGKGGVVVGVCSGRNKAMVEALGCDVVEDYTSHPPDLNFLGEKYNGRKFDVAIDCYGIQSFWTHSPSYLVPKGLFVTVGIAFQEYTLASIFNACWLMMVKNPLTPIWLGGVPRTYLSVMGVVNEERMKELGRLVQEGTLKAVNGDGVWEMEDVKKAYAIMLNRRARGKIIVKIGRD